MNKKTRIILFLTCLFVFAIVTPLAILHSQGYKIDFNPAEGRIKISQTGGLFLKILPRQADIYINGKLNKRTDFFFGSALIENLLPKKHKIEVKKQGYHDWEKTLEIKKIEVVEAKNIILFPKEIDFEILSDKTENIWLSFDQKKIVSLEKNQTSDENPLKEEIKLDWALKLYDLDKNIKSHLINKADISRQEFKLINFEFSQDSKKIYLEIIFNDILNELEKENIKKFILEIDKEKPVLIEKEVPLLLAENIENIVCWKIINNDIYYLDNSGYFFKNEEKLSQENFPLKEKNYSLEIFENFIFLQEKDKQASSLFLSSYQENKTAYKFNFDLEKFETFFEKMVSFKISPDGKKLVYSSNHEIWILFLKDDQSSSEKKADEKILLIRLAEPIKNVSWINDNYLIFISNDKLKISEIDNRDKVNVIDLLESKKLPEEESFNKAFFSLFSKKAYFLTNKEGLLYHSSPLFP